MTGIFFKYTLLLLPLLSRFSRVRLWDPIDGSPPGSPVPGILQARTLEWVAISFSNAWKWSRSVVSDSQRPHGLQPTRLLHPWDFPGKSTGVGCHCLLQIHTSSALLLDMNFFTWLCWLYKRLLSFTLKICTLFAHKFFLQNFTKCLIYWIFDLQKIHTDGFKNQFI